MFDPSSGNNKEQLVFWLKTYHQCDARDPHVNAYGETYVSVVIPHDPILDRDEFIDSISVMSQTMKRCLVDIDVLLPNFGWVGKECIRDTLSWTTQHYRADQLCL